MKKSIYSCMTKGVIAEGEQMKYGPNWVTARRARLQVHEDKLVCGDWTIDYSDISEATLYSIRSSLMIPGYILKVVTENKSYHFGLNWGSFWKRTDLPFEFNREKGKLQFSLFSIIIRLILLGYIAQYFYKKLM